MSWKDYGELIDLTRNLSKGIRDAVRVHMGSERAKGIKGEGASGDITFGIDEIAEFALEKKLEGFNNIAYYTEDRGLIIRGEPEHLFVIDPIDGTRPAACGLEACCVTIAVAPFDCDNLEKMVIGDIFFGLVQEIKNDVEFIALKGKGAKISYEGCEFQPLLSKNDDISRLFWTTGFRGRPAEPLVTVLGKLIDLSSVDGACFDLGSASFGITRVITGQMDSYVDVGQRMADEIPVVRRKFQEIGHGSILNNYSYDVAAASLVASECGASVSDAYGKSLDNYPLIPSEGRGQVSTVVSSNRVLHEKILREIDDGMKKLKERLINL